ncbi:MAG: carboxypeptidase regulatory-like domain-containing protein, partial [Myxococcales bacterium]|nr:carboxypeptidase regulatory-like domain-containing protein [Myxococcales bacterium]
MPQPPGAFVITDAEDLIGGPASDGRLGDVLMRSEKIQVVISSNTDETGAPRARNGGGRPGPTEYAGNLIDADLVRPDPTTERDLLHGVAPMINVESTTAPLEVTIVNGTPTAENPMVVQVTAVDAPYHAIDGSSLRRVVPTLEDSILGIPIQYPSTFDNRNLPVEIVTTYTLPLDSDTVEIVTTVRNTSAQEFRLPVGAFFSAQAPLTQFVSRFGFGSLIGYTALSPYVAFAPSDPDVGVSYGYVVDPNDFTNQGVQRTSSSVATPAGALIVQDEDVRILIGARLEPVQDYQFRLIPASGEVAFRRLFVVGDGEIKPIARVRDQVVGSPTGRIEGVVQSPDGVLAGAQVALLLDNPFQDLRDFSFGNNVIQGFPFDPGRSTFTDDEGRFAFDVPAGIYSVASSTPDYPYELGRVKIEQPNATRKSVVAGFTETVAIVHPEPGLLQVDIVDEASNPSPGRVTLVGIDRSPDPIVDNGEIRLQIPPFVPIWEAGYFQDITDDHPQWGVAKTLFVGLDGTTGAFPIDPGVYQVCVSRGPAFNAWCSDAQAILPGASITPVRAVLTRVVDTAGLLSVDTGQRGAASTDGRSSLVERIAANLAEDVELFVGADRDIVTDYTPGFTDIGADLIGLVAWAPGARAATFDYGHYTAFPFRVPADHAEALALAPDWTIVDDAAPPPVASQYPSNGAFVASPRQLFAKMRAAFEGPAGGIIQLDRVNDPAAGQFAQLDIDSRPIPPRARVTAQSRRINPAEALFSADFDAIEIWNGG